MPSVTVAPDLSDCDVGSGWLGSWTHGGKSSMSDEKRLKLTLAAIVVLWILAILTYEIVVDSQAQLSGKVHRIPEFFVQLCQAAVGAGIAALSVSIAATIASAYRTAFKRNEGDEEDNDAVQ